MFGIGGGLLMVPAMVFLMGFAQHKAQGTSLAVLMVPVGILGAINYFKAGNVDVKVAALIAVGFVGGSYFGSKFVLGLPESTVKRAFAVFLAVVAVYTWFKATPAPPVPDEVPNSTPAP